VIDEEVMMLVESGAMVEANNLHIFINNIATRMI
jgi:hypothetical protein